MLKSELTSKIIARFWSHVDHGGTGCWEWQASCRSGGYGQFGVAAKDIRSAHRVAYEIEYGPVPEGLDVDHLCRNRKCCNPAHLEAVTRQVNVLRGVSTAAERAKQTHCKNGHEYDEKNTGRNNGGHRRCRACDRNRHRAKARV